MLSDGKEYELFELKSFAFSNEPSEWAYDVEEEINGSTQAIDITDDLTGTPHENARKEIPMYVNEVGHGNEYTQNTFVRELDERTVHYFFRTPRELQGGDSIELLTNYRKEYEDARERKGYGIKNIHRGDKTDQDYATLLKRNLLLRVNVEATVNGLSLPELARHMSYLASNIWEPLYSQAEAFLLAPRTHPATVLSILQWKALIRLAWIRELSVKRLAALRAEFSNRNGCQLHCGGFANLCDQIHQKMQIGQEVDLSVLWSERFSGSIGKEVVVELSEVHFYNLRDRIRLPLQSSLWCPLAADLLQDLSRLVVKRSADPNRLQELFLRTATRCMQRIAQCAAAMGDGMSALTFGPGMSSKVSPESIENAAKSFQDCASFWFVGHDTMPKALSAAIVSVIDEQQETVEKLQVDKLSGGLGSKGGFVMAVFHGFKGEDQWRPLASVVRPLARVQKSAESKVNVAWYQTWQCLYVVHAFATVFLPGATSDMIQELCSDFHLDSRLIWFAANRKIGSERTAAADKAFKEAKAAGRSDLVLYVRSAEGERKQKAVSERKKAHRRQKLQKIAVAAGEKVRKNKVHSKKKRLPEGLSAGSSCGRLPPKELYHGKPTVDLPGGWPEGWTQKTYQRQSGASKGHTDDYFFSPQLGLKIRSKTDVLRFLKKLGNFNGDEQALKEAQRFKAT